MCHNAGQSDRLSDRLTDCSNCYSQLKIIKQKVGKVGSDFSLHTSNQLCLTREALPGLNLFSNSTLECGDHHIQRRETKCWCSAHLRGDCGVLAPSVAEPGQLRGAVVRSSVHRQEVPLAPVALDVEVLDVEFNALAQAGSDVPETLDIAGVNVGIVWRLKYSAWLCENPSTTLDGPL